MSLHTDSESVARSKSDRAWQHLIEGWQTQLAGSTGDTTARHAAAVELTRIRGFRYLDVEDGANLPTPELVDRARAIDVVDERPDVFAAEALLGTAPRPELPITEALELYWDLARDKRVGKTRTKFGAGVISEIRRSTTSSISLATSPSMRSPEMTCWIFANIG